uniref:Nucleotide-diphospho-sugar transferase domain-containing protein n=1 Tax=Oryza rufipogon TaxID=4529 RepID=A0A0E0N6W6_ORYRU
MPRGRGETAVISCTNALATGQPMMMGGQQSALNQLVSFLLGVSAAAVLIFFFSSAGGGWSTTTDLSSWANGTVAATAKETNLTSTAAHVEEKANLTNSQAAAAEAAKEEEEKELEKLLAAVADEHKNIIMTSVNEAWAAPGSLLDLFLEGFRAGEGIARFVDHLLIVALDDGAFRRCRDVHPHCYRLAVAGRNFTDEKVFMSEDYLDLVWSKVKLQQRILELGYNFLFTDVDILWFRDPFEQMSMAAHMVTSSDFFIGGAYNPANFPNTGFLYVRSSRRAVGVMEAWRAARASYPGRHEQQVLNEIKRELVERRGVRIQFLDTAHVAGFCSNTRDFATLYTMHANCCVGLGAKLHDLRNLLEEWRAYRRMPDEQRRQGPVRWKIKGNLRRFFVFLFELWLAATLVLVLLCVLANTGGSPEMPAAAEVCNCSQIGIASSRISEEVTGTSDLAELLPKVATDDRTVIITSVNEAFARPNSLLVLFRESFAAGEKIAHLLDHVLVVAVDPAAFHHCRAVHPHCYHLKVDTMNLSSANNFMSEAYVELVWTKLSLQQRVLELGYNFLFTDCDMVLFRDPFRHIAVYADMSTSSDDYSAARAPLDNPLNTGLYYVKATSQSVEMLRYWQAARPRFPGAHDQAVFGHIKHELVAKLRARIEPLDTLYFGGFCEYHDDLARAVTMHADCCVGLDTKVHDLTDIAADWKNYTGMSPEERKKGGFKWTYPTRCRNSIGWRMASSKNGLSPVVVFLLGAASATALIVFVFTSTASPAWPTPEATPATRQEKKAAAVACAPRAKRIDSETRRAARTNQTGGGDDDDEFARMVRRAAMEDRTVIMTSVNEAWAAPGSLMDSFLESFRVGENISHFVEHIVVVAMDEGALRRCRAIHPHCYLLLPEVAGLDLSGAKIYMTKDYLDLVWSKLKLQQRASMIVGETRGVDDEEHDARWHWQDVDLAWFRNPMVHITAAADITTSSDFYFGDPDDLGNYPNTGFIYFKATPRNARAMAYWHAARRRFPGEHDQFVFNEIKRELAAGAGEGGGVGVRIRFIDTAAVSGFCQLGRDLNRIATVHMTCCIGLENKLHDLRNVIRDWRRYVARPRWERQMGKIGWTFEGGNEGLA